MRPKHPALAPYVASMVAYDVDLREPGIHRGLPSTTVTFVMPLDEPLTVSWAGAPSSRTTGWSSLSGLHTGPAEIHHDGHQRGIQLALTLRGARALLGVPSAVLARELVALEDVVPELRHLPDQLASAPWPRAQETVERVLLSRLARSRRSGPPAEVGRALAMLTRGARVEETAADVGYSRRRLTDLVRAECGLTPKEYQRIARFERATTLVGRRPLVEVASRCGYADQAHLAREWRELAGCTPTQWLREEFPFVQDGGAAVPQDSGT